MIVKTKTTSTPLRYFTQARKVRIFVENYYTIKLSWTGIMQEGLKSVPTGEHVFRK